MNKERSKTEGEIRVYFGSLSVKMISNVLRFFLSNISLLLALESLIFSMLLIIFLM